MAGPFSQTTIVREYKVSNPDTGALTLCRTLYKPQVWWTQNRRNRNRGIPLAYSMNLGVVDSTFGKNQTCDAPSEVAYTTLSDESRWGNVNNLVSNRALSKFVSDAQGVAQASLGETLGEWRDSLNTITKRLGQLATAARCLRKGLLSEAARALGLTPDVYGKTTGRRLKSFGDLWLELHLGWVPLITDIYNACDLVDREVLPKTACGRGGSSNYYRTKVETSLTRIITEVNYRVGYRVQGDVHVINPNVALLAQAGLANPVSVAWALVPYSFVFDWFVDLGGYLGMLDGLLGCRTERTFYTTLRTSSGKYTHESYSNALGGWVLNVGTRSRGVRCQRTLGLPPVHLTYISAPRFSWQRGLTAIALLMKYL